MLKKKVEKMPLCINCKNCCTIKAKNNKGIEIKCHSYCQFFKKIVNTNNYLENCNGYEDDINTKNQSDLEIMLSNFNKLYSNRENNSDIELTKTP